MRTRSLNLFFSLTPNFVHRQVTLEEANTKALELNIMFMETSAKAGHNVKSLFKKIAMSLVGMEKDNEAVEQQNTSAFEYTSEFSYIDHLPFPLEIDVTAPVTAEMPDASQCAC